MTRARGRHVADALTGAACLLLAVLIVLAASRCEAAVTQGGRAQGGRTGEQRSTSAAHVRDWCLEADTTYCIRHEENGTDVRVNSALATSCGGDASDCDLTPVGGSIARDSAIRWEGSYSSTFPAGTRTLECADATCTVLDGTGAFAAGTAAYSSFLAVSAFVLVGKWSAADNGWALTTSMGTLARAQCQVGTNPDESSVVLVANRWAELGCDYDGSKMRTCVNGACTSGTTDTLVANDFDYQLGDDDAGAGFVGQMDISWRVERSLTAAEWCRIHSCGYANQHGCECFDHDPTAWAYKGLNSEMGSCTLPTACNGGL